MKSKKPILFVIGDGIGNQIQTIPAFLYCRKKFKDRKIYVYNSIPTQTKITKMLFGGKYGLKADDVFCAIYDKDGYHQNTKLIDIYSNGIDGGFQILTASCYGAPVFYRGVNIPVYNEKILGMIKKWKWTEVECNLRSSMDENFSDSDFSEFGNLFHDINKKLDVPDILIHNGYSRINKNSEKMWKAKKYPNYKELSRILISLGYSVGSIGDKREFIDGTVNLTGLRFKDTVAVIKRTKLLISNDTSTYHLANVVKIPNIVLFTFTNMDKNYDKRFHIYSHPIQRKDLSCCPCQKWNKYGYWLKNKNKCKWECRNIDMKMIVNKCREILS